MTNSEGHPWDSYGKDTLPPGFTYPIGRDAVEKELVAAEASVGPLFFSRPKLNPPNDPPIVVRLHWSGLGNDGYLHTKIDAARGANLIMWVDGVPSADREVIRAALEEGALRRACQWAARFNNTGDSTWAMGESEFYLTWSGSSLTESSSWPPTAART